MGSETPTQPRKSAHLKLFASPEAPSFEQVSTCVHCGFCLEACPTYRELRVEMDSPRGRLYLVKGLLKGQIEPGDEVLRHLDQCLDCRACETACPSGVPYAEILERSRTVLEPLRQRPAAGRWLRRLFFERVLPSRRVQRVVLRTLWWAQSLGLLALGRRLARLGWLPGRRLQAAAANPPLLPPRAFRDTVAKAFDPRGGTYVFPAQGARRHKVALFTGCLADHMFASVNADTVEVLTRNGCEVHVVPEEACCGALHIHNGARTEAVALAKRNIEAFAPHGFDAVISNAAGCGAELRHTQGLLPNDAEAVAFDHKVRDICEFLVEIGFETPRGPSGGSVLSLAYDEPCHLVHAQKVSAAPKQVLAALPGYRPVPLENADTCCGSAGLYAVLQPQLAGSILDRKLAALVASGAQVVATGNPGCLLQIGGGVGKAGLAMRVAHPVSLLAEAYRAESGPSSSSPRDERPM
ncbi:MAG: 4Fe-4S dicluster domain-containing protein [Myxococcales bacterium]|nr:4Fe-4S dicluster domain-containing protein [Myxococcales bacterium]